MAGLQPEDLATLGSVASDLAALYARWLAEMEAFGLADRAAVYACARAALEATRAARPILLLDLRVTTALEARLVGALAERSSGCLATVPSGDARTLALLEAALRAPAEELAPSGRGALGALQRNLFRVDPTDAPGLDESVTLTGSPGIARECVEIARAVQERAEAGVPFDAMAVLVHAPGEYAAHVEEALRRAEIPAYFVRGTRRPHPAGRALLALLACAAEQLSARRFAEYLSLAQVPIPGLPPQSDRLVPAHDDLLPARVAELAVAVADDEPEGSSEGALEGALEKAGNGAPAPWRWDRLLTDAAVIGGRERWRRRLDGLDAELRLQISRLDDGDDPRGVALERRRRDLAALAAFALPVIDRLAELPEGKRPGASGSTSSLRPGSRDAPRSRSLLGLSPSSSRRRRRWRQAPTSCASCWPRDSAICPFPRRGAVTGRSSSELPRAPGGSRSTPSSSPASRSASSPARSSKIRSSPTRCAAFSANPRSRPSRSARPTSASRSVSRSEPRERGWC
jgi:hypothetical protein